MKDKALLCMKVSLHFMHRSENFIQPVKEDDDTSPSCRQLGMADPH